MNVPRPKWTAQLAWFWAATMVLLLTAGVLYSAPRGRGAGAQEKEAARAAANGDQSTSLHDQTDLAVTVYNSNIALVRDVRQLALPSGAFRLKFMESPPP